MPSTTFTANFGRARSGLATVGYRLGDTWRILAGIGELVPGSGIYGVTLPNPATPKYLLMDTGGDRPLYAVEDIDVLGAGAVFRSANFGRARAGLTTVGYTLLGRPRVAPVPELVPGSGVYGMALAPEAGYVGPITFDTGEVAPAYAAGFIDIVAALSPLPVPSPGTPPDFLAALLGWLRASTTIAALFPISNPAAPEYVPGADSFNLGEAPADIRAYPFGVLLQQGEQTGGYNLSKAYWIKQYYRFAVYDEYPDNASLIAYALRRELDTLADHPLVFADGRQMRWWMTGGTLIRDPRAVSRFNQAPLWQRSLSYGVQIATSRP